MTDMNHGDGPIWPAMTCNYIGDKRTTIAQHGTTTDEQTGGKPATGCIAKFMNIYPFKITGKWNLSDSLASTCVRALTWSYQQTGQKLP